MLLSLATALPLYSILVPFTFFICWAILIPLWYQLVESKHGTEGPKIHSGLRMLLEQRKQFYSHSYSPGSFQRHQILGRTFVTTFLGATTIHTIDTANIRTITTHKFDDWGKSEWAAISGYCLGAGVLLNDGEAWKQSRAILKPVFGSLQLAQIGKILEKHTATRFNDIRKFQGNDFNFHEIASSLMIQVIGDILWSESALWQDASAKHDRERFLHHVSSLEGTSAACFNLGVGALPELLTQTITTCKSVIGMRAYFKQRIARACAVAASGSTNESVNTCIARLLMGPHVGNHGSEGELRNLFFASFDTTSALLSNLVRIISCRPEIQKILRSQLAFLDGGAPSQADIAKCQYLRYVILETMRLFTPVTYHCRQAKINTVLPSGGGCDGTHPLFVRKGSNIVWSVYSLNRDKELWGVDSEVFRPERWQNVLAHEHFMPFGSGPRQCPGQMIAQYMVSYIIIRLLQSFDTIVHVGNDVLEEALAVSFFDRHGARVSIR